MFWFVVFIILLLAGAGAGIYAFVGEPDYKAGFSIGAAAAVVVAFLLLFISGIREVPTRSVGVPTSFGRVEGTLQPGFHWEMPWTGVSILDETIQTTTFEGASCLEVRIGGQQTACLDVTIQWRILDAAAPALYSDYNGQGASIMATITDAVVVRELKQVVNQVLGDYNPIADVSANTAAGNSQFSTFGPKVLRQMRGDLAGRITVVSVLMPLLRYDSATQARLNQIQQQYGLTAIAQQQVATNAAQAQANAEISGSLSNNPGVLEYECLQITQDALKAGTSLPAGWNCFGSSPSLAVGGK